jgi:transaldolase
VAYVNQKVATSTEELSAATSRYQDTPILDYINRVQTDEVTSALAGGAPSCVSVFAGRVADTGRDPVPLMAAAVEMVSVHPGMELIWASPRELLNIFQADAVGCHIITATSDILQKLSLVGKDLGEYSLDTVKMFHSDAVKSGFTI